MCRDCSSFSFYPALAGMLSPTLIQHQVLRKIGGQGNESASKLYAFVHTLGLYHGEEMIRFSARMCVRHTRIHGTSVPRRPPVLATSQPGPRARGLHTLLIYTML
jgi:hypothetical protein